MGQPLKRESRDHSAQPPVPARSVDERIEAIEAALPGLPRRGVTIVRRFGSEGVLEWHLQLGAVALPKTTFTGPSLEDVVLQAETAVQSLFS